MGDKIELIELGPEPEKEPFKEPVAPKPRKSRAKATTINPGEIPQEIPEEIPRNINFNTDNDKSHTALSVSLAKLLFLLSFVGAIASKQNAWLLHDDEAMGIAVPAMNILMRLNWFRSAISTYGQYVVGFDDTIPLFIAIYAYYERVRKETDREPTTRRGDAIGPKQADAGRVEPIGSNGLSPLANIPAFGREA